MLSQIIIEWKQASDKIIELSIHIRYNQASTFYGLVLFLLSSLLREAVN
jgi:hypothetical protein